MRYEKITLLVILLLASATLSAQGLFNHQWSVVFTDENYCGVSSFSLYLKQEGDIITGQHLRVLNYGNRIDEYEDSINGTAKDSVAIINIRTGRTLDKDRAMGKAKLEIKENGSLLFTLLKEPIGVHFFPDSMVLYLIK